MIVMTTDEAAEVAGVKASTIRGWVLKGWLEPVRRGAKPLRFRYDDVARCQREHRPETWRRKHRDAAAAWSASTNPQNVQR